MHETTQNIVTETGLPGRPKKLHKPSSLGISNRIAQFLTVAVIVFAITTVGFAFWITREHNRLAATGSEQMIRGGLAALDETLKTVAMDFAIWPDAVKALRAKDDVWVWENIGISAAVTETTDLMMIVPSEGTAYGWSPGMDETPSTELLPAEAIQQMMDLLEPVPIKERRAVTNLLAPNGDIWLLAAARIVSDDPSEDPASDTDIPRLIFGFNLNADSIREIGQQYLIPDLTLYTDSPAGTAVIPLRDAQDRTVAHASWTPPKPGDQILRRLAIPLTVALGILTLIALVSSNLLSRSARRLEATMLTVQEASRAKTDFIANISHELRTPMNGIIGLATLLRQSKLEDKQSQMVGMLLSSAETQMSLIGDLLDISSIENGRFSLTIAPFSPTEVARETCEIFRIDAEQKGLRIEIEISDPEGALVLGDRERFRQICANLVSNAVKFTDNGGIDIRLKIRERLGEGIVTFEVIDTGRGISETDVERVFLRFAQGATKERGKAAGSGLGLSITKTIVELMGGTVSVNSKLGEGSAFLVEIPFEQVDASTAQETADSL